ncbi:hypothetical protein BX600DRAFT_508193 [Xylariales sp. PMI_506]|nr:hypothetical protein BX600DRAFT_508193 [Xylariales sp. PMI_506]
MADHMELGCQKQRVDSFSSAQSDLANQLDEATTAAGSPPTHEMTGLVISKLLENKECETETVQTKIGLLRLLDLPIDILRLIVKEITHTNDLTALALTCSTLYNVSVPLIYARFDIVWPDTSAPLSESKSVDALTYGLSTLCLGSKFANRMRWARGRSGGQTVAPQRRLENQYAKYTRKFSLGNGPPAWVSEYNITKESGKMLGTLVALAVAKMTNLETFIWDMPTGVLSDVFMGLASLQDQYPDGKPKLEKVWIRWHDNWEVNGPNSSLSSPMSPVVAPVNAPPVHPSHTVLANHQASSPSSQSEPPKYSDIHVEYPTFSILAPLKSLTVLDIDELAYLDEMSILIGRSRDSLQELRVGISQKAMNQDFVGIWKGVGLRQVDMDARWPGESTIGDKRLGGVLGVLVGRIYEIRQKTIARLKHRSGAASASPNPNETEASSQVLDKEFGSRDGTNAEEARSEESTSRGNEASAVPQLSQSQVSKTTGETYNDSDRDGTSRNGKLRLHTLELERMPLSIHVCYKAFDWSILTNLTILNCSQHETLWRVLKKQFQPVPPPHGAPANTSTLYRLALKKIHTDATTHALLSFIKETLEPNTLEAVFLQDRRRSAPPSVSISMILKMVVKRHHSSLKKLLIDSTEKVGREASRSCFWALSTEMVLFITSGKMRNLRELGATLYYKDWHTFLQRLPAVPQLRSLHINYMHDYPGGSLEPRELALQLIDIITLRPEVKLCYVGIGTKCFEILECTPTSGTGAAGEDLGANGFMQFVDPISVVDIDDEDEEVDHENSDTETEEDHITGMSVNGATDSEDDEYTDVSDLESVADGMDGVGDSPSAPRLRLREILFYDDKVSIFKARHGCL